MKNILIGLVGATIGLAVGLWIEPIVSGSDALSPAVPVILDSAVIPALIAILGAYFSASLGIKHQRKKERKVAKQQWRLKTVSLLQRITMECQYLDGDESIESREFPTAAYQSGNTGPLTHLDTLFQELMDHYTHAPPNVDEKWKVAIARLHRQYVNPVTHPELDDEYPSETRYFKTTLRLGIEQTLADLGEVTEGVDAEQLPDYTAPPQTDGS